MDQIKIGRYIAEKRRKLNLTQAQLAEQLGMSDKSVSKWERGVCLPDVSVYKPLCEALGISLNEFLAGEDIPAEVFAAKSENNIIQIVKEHKVNKQKLKRIIALLTAAVVLISSVMLYMLIKDGKFMLNYIMPLPGDSLEIQIAEMMTDKDAYLYEFNVEEKYNNIEMKLHTYEHGKFTGTRSVADIAFFDGYDGKGMITLIADNENRVVKAIISSSGGTSENEIVLVEDDVNGDWFGSSVDRPEEETRIEIKGEMGLLALVHDYHGVCSGIGMDIVDAGFWPKGKEIVEGLEENDYTFFFTVEFGTAESPD